MNFPESAPVRPEKLAELKERLARLGVRLCDVDETFVKGGGKGGQKINKTSSRVILDYPALGIVVRCQRERSLALNRFLALRELADKIEMKVSPETSERLREFEKIRRRKNR